jgi:hypothetical protein
MAYIHETAEAKTHQIYHKQLGARWMKEKPVSRLYINAGGRLIHWNDLFFAPSLLLYK